MNQFEKMVNELSLYEEEDIKLAAIKKQNEAKIKSLEEEFNTFKTNILENFEDEKSILLEIKQIEKRQQKLEQETKEIKAEEMTQAFFDYIKTSKQNLENDLQKNTEKLNKLTSRAKAIINEKEEELKEKVIVLNSQIDKQNEVAGNIIRDIKIPIKKIDGKEIEQFLITFLKKETGKTFTSMKDKTVYSYTYWRGRDDYEEPHYFYGVKSGKKNFSSFKELQKGIKNKEVILMGMDEIRQNFYTPNYLCHFKEKIEEGWTCRTENISLVVPTFSIKQSVTSENSYFKIYPNLKSELIKFLHNLYLKEEKESLKQSADALNRLKQKIDSSEERMNKEIENIKRKYEQELKNDKFNYFQNLNEYQTKKEELNLAMSKNTKTLVEENTDEDIQK